MGTVVVDFSNGSPFKLALILLTFYGSVVSTYKIRHYKDRFKRHQGANLYLPGTYVTSGGDEGAESGPWTEWSEPSACSRTCGGGVATQTRRCQQGYDCGGPTKRHFSCNTQDCPDLGNFRAQQCSEYDTVPLEGIYYQWTPYTKGANLCELNCMPKGDRFYYRQNEKVVDGTRCNEDSLDVCIEGNCYPVGCDMMLGSNTQEDNCRVCGGDGSSCNRVSGLLDMQDLQVGYNDILLVPEGATNIKVWERANSNNYLAMRNTSGYYCLNGNWKITFPTSLECANTVFHYSRSPQAFAAPDVITSLGPTEEPIFIVLLYEDTNVGVNYEYSVPKGVKHGGETETYAWTFDEFIPCTASCGGGVQYRNVTCAGRKSLKPSDSNLCDPNNEPVSSQRCNDQPCEPQWTAKEWSNCSVACGDNGTQTRQVVCEQIIANGFPSIVDDSNCANVRKPTTEQPCNQGVICANWFIGPWKPCDKLCGEGKQTRQVKCYRKEDHKIEVLDEAFCTLEEKPDKEKSCNLRPCEGLDWVTSDWSGCENKCGLSNETRRVQCSTAKGEVYPDELCSNIPKPELIRQCNTSSDKKECQHIWYASQWSDCSARCGEGVQTRRVFCAKETEDGMKKVEDNLCDEEKKYDSIKNCTGEEDKCTGEWFSGPWSDCSKECGGGMRTRKVICMRDSITVAAKECDPAKIALSVENCNPDPCTDKNEKKTTKKPKTSTKKPKTSSEKPKTSSEKLKTSSEKPKTSSEKSKTSSEKPKTSSEKPMKSTTAKNGETEDEKGTESTTTEGLTKTTDEKEENVTEPTKSTDEKEENVTEPTKSTDEKEEESDEEYVDEIDTECEDGEWIDVAPEDEPSDDRNKKTTLPEFYETPGDTGEPTLTSEDLMVSDDAFASTPDKISTVITTFETGSGETETETESISSTSMSSSTTTLEGSGETDSTTVFTTESTESTESSTTAASTDSSSTITNTNFTSTISQTETGSTTLSTITEMITSTLSTLFTTTETTLTPTSTTEINENATTITSTENTESTPSITTSSEDDLTSVVTYTTNTESSSTDSSTSTTDSITSTTLETTTGETTTEGSTTDSTESSTTSETTEESTSETSTKVTDSSTTEVTSESSTTEVTSESSTTEVTTEISTTEVTSESSTTEVTSESSTTEVTSESSTTDVTSESSTTGGTTTVMTESTSDHNVWTSTTPVWETTKVSEIFTKLRMCRRRKMPDCKKSKYGCCIDEITSASGPFNKGCPDVKTCNETKYGCCEDGVSVAKGKRFKGCPSTHCDETLFGCCSDEKTAAEGPENEGCPPPPPACLKSKFGCCQDNETEAMDVNGKGCEETTTEEPDYNLTTTTEMVIRCDETTYGCCPDGVAIASGEDYMGCNIIQENCTESYFGCCPDGSSAKGPNYKGCKMECESSPYGCCDDGLTPAHGPSREGCCLSMTYGCCPDNIIAAAGPNLEGCGCQYSPYGCCPDNTTSARGYNNEGCGCQHTEHGCCPDNFTPAPGPDFQGCQCHTFQFGCCPDGVTAAAGLHGQGCGCQNTEFKCCSDDSTPASGPNFEGCACDSSKYGCCPDGVTEALGDNFDGCQEVPKKLQDSCTLTKERGPCTNYTVKWFFDMEYGGCSRFWYGGCEGNENRFKNQEECQSVCVEPEGRDRCLLPKVNGPCDGYYPMWHYDNDNKQCVQFIYTGCLGNKNRFETREECSSLCVNDNSIDACDQHLEEGPCRGNYPRWSYDKESKTCKQFIYGGCKGNNNNFPTEKACQQQCNQPGKKKDHCSLPRAQGNCTGKEPKWYYDSIEKRCMPFYYTGCDGNANNFISREACELDCPKDIKKDACLLPADTGPCYNYDGRYYYDTTSKQCVYFYYGGCEGNDNNFLTNEACEQRCSGKVVPPVVTEPPAKPPTEPPPSGDIIFTPDMCFLPQESGPCFEYVARWFYDRNDGVCKQFIFGGCESNGNNFNSSEECHSKCGSVQDLCILPAVVGPCDGEFEQWHHDPTTKSCRTFKYGGCLGNDNRFDSKEACERGCLKDDTGGQNQTTIDESVPAICRDRVDAGNCNESLSQYYYDGETGKCLAFVYTGCGGNENRFNSEEQCERQCGKFRDQDVCKLSKETGRCRGYFIKYYYDSSYDKCLQFVYGGCEGNGNRFSSQDECETVCFRNVQEKPNVTSRDICLLPVDSGPCNEGYKQYYFDNTRGDCVPFIYGGCSGNRNNFKTYHACRDYCKDFLTPVDSPPSPGQPEPDQCKNYLEECNRIICEYGSERFVDQELLCTRCRCHDPCREIACPSNTRCAVDINTNRTSDSDSNFAPVCRNVEKEGNCPELIGDRTRCEKECRDDADCSVDLKCCPTECGTSCVVPQISPPGNITTGETNRPAFTRPPIEIGQYPPKENVENYEPEVVAGEGDYANLKCSVRGNPNPTITWKKGDLLIDGSQPRYRILLDGVLQIITLHKTDSGVYLCIASNPLGQVQQEINLQVTVPVKTKITSDKQQYPVGNDITLTCLVEGYPEPLVEWYKNGQPLLKSDKLFISGNHKIYIRRVNEEDTGEYACKGTNQFSTSTSTISIKIEGGMKLHPNCTDNKHLADCKKIIRMKLCVHEHYGRFCCKSCTEAGLLPLYGPHLKSRKNYAIANNQV